MKVVIPIPDDLERLHQMFSVVSETGVSFDETLCIMFTGVNQYCSLTEIMGMVKDYISPVDDDSFKNEMLNRIMNVYNAVFVKIIEYDLQLPISLWAFESDGLRIAFGEGYVDVPSQINGYY